MVRMSDLVRGAKPSAPASAPPAAAPAPSPAPRAPSVPAAGETAPGPRVMLRPAPTAPVAAKAPSAETPTDAIALFDELQTVLEAVRDRARSSQSPSWEALTHLVGRVVDSLAASGELFWAANAPIVPGGHDYLAFHQACVAVLAVRLGANVGYDRANLVQLGLAGCLIDVGLWQLPPATLRRLDTLNGEELTQYRAHPRLGAEIVRRWTPPFEGLVDAVLQHHEREQGQGFPQGLAGANVHPYAKILGLVDTYTGLTAPPSLRPGLRPHEAVREIVRSKNESFPPPMIKALLSEISVFPPGTLVRLNTGEVGRVIAVNRNHPLRPRVEVYDAKGQRLPTTKMIDLSEAPFLYITGPVSEAPR
jgi:HD-GYP domain-containing protein (c-di-GMP phosphodiesterase class II)